MLKIASTRERTNQKVLSPFKGDADAEGASVATTEPLGSQRSTRRDNETKCSGTEGVTIKHSKH